jgi:hypothetical protein
VTTTTVAPPEDGATSGTTAGDRDVLESLRARLKRAAGRDRQPFDFDLLAQAWINPAPFREGKRASSHPPTSRALEGLVFAASPSIDSFTGMKGEERQAVMGRVASGGPFKPWSLVDLDGASTSATVDVAVRPEIPDLIPGAHLLDTEYPPVEYAIDPIAPRRELVEWVGKHGIYKSTLALAACLSVASGRRFGGLPVTRGKAVFITAEDSERTIAFRVRAWLESIPVGPERAAATKAVRENFHFLAREHVRGLALTMVQYGEPSARADVVARVTELVTGALIVFLETAARLADGNENENRVQAAFAQTIEEIAAGSGAAVGIVRHVSKASAREGATDSYAGRGGGALSDAARSVVNFTRPDPKGGEEPDPFIPVTMTHAKATLSRPASKILWQPVETPSGVYLRALSDDETIRANARKLLAAIPPEGFTETEVHKRPPAGLSRTAAKAALDLLRETGRVVPFERQHGGNRQPVTAYRPQEPTP